MTLALVHPTAKIAFLGIAFIVSYSRIYVGVHYPLDVIGGAAIGMFIAYFVWTVIGNPWVNQRKKSTQRRGIARDPLAKRHPRHRFDR